MELGEKLRMARLEAGFSQRELCGERITRNMLSQIENGTARPSMKTLQYLASRLGKPVGFFLEEGMAPSPNEQQIIAARQCFDQGNWQGALDRLQDFQQPDPVFQREWDLLWRLSCLELAEQAILERREIYARQLLERSRVEVSYCGQELDRRYWLLLGRLGHLVSGKLPSLDTELLVRAREARQTGDLYRAGCLLDGVELHSPDWHLLRGQVFMDKKAYREASAEFLLAEAAFPKETVPQLEACFRELGDYEKAYFYACKARDL